MNGYVALKNATFNGVEYLAGSNIPEEAVLPSRVPSLLRTGMIAKAETPPQGPQDDAGAPGEYSDVILPIQGENGAMELSATSEDIVTAVTVLQMKQDEAAAAVKAVASETALILIDACTKNQALKKAARDRAAALAKEDGEE